MRMPLRVTAGLASTALSLTLSGCGGGGAETASPDSRLPTSITPTAKQAASKYDTTWEDSKPVFVPAAIGRYGTDAITRATNGAVTFTKDYGFNREIMTAPLGGREQAVLAMTKAMTADAASDWTTAVKEYNSGKTGSEKRASLIMSLTLYSTWSGDDKRRDIMSVAPKGPAAVNPQVKKVKTDLETDGRAKVAVTTSADVRLVVKQKPVLMKVTRTQMFWMKQTPNGWKIDGWKGGLKAGKYRPDK